VPLGHNCLSAENSATQVERMELTSIVSHLPSWTIFRYRLAANVIESNSQQAAAEAQI